LLCHKLPIGTWTWTWFVAPCDECTAIERDHVAPRVSGAGLERTADFCRQRLVEHRFHFVTSITLKPGDGLSHHTENKIAFFHEEGLKIFFPPRRAGVRELEAAGALLEFGDAAFQQFGGHWRFFPSDSEEDTPAMCGRRDKPRCGPGAIRPNGS